MKNFVLGFLATIVIIAGGLVAYLRCGVADVRADVVAPAWQSWLFQSAARASIRRRAPGGQSPMSHTDAELIDGGKIYLDGCAGCHGKPGRPLRKRPIFFPPPQLAHVATQYSEPELFWIIKHGIRRTGMSAYGTPGDYSERQLWLLAEFVKRANDLPPAVREALRPAKP